MKSIAHKLLEEEDAFAIATRYYKDHMKKRIFDSDGIFYEQGGQSRLGPRFRFFFPRYCFVCPILLGLVGIRQNGQNTLVSW